MQDIWNVHMEGKKVPEQPKEGGGILRFSFCTLRREVIGLSRADSGTSFCELHTKEQIMDTGRGGREDGGSGIFSWHDTWYTKELKKKDLIWIKMHFHVRLFFLLFECL